MTNIQDAKIAIPDDLNAFCAKIIEEVEEGRHKRSDVNQ